MTKEKSNRAYRNSKEKRPHSIENIRPHLTGKMVFLGESKGTLISGQEWKGILQAKEITYTHQSSGKALYLGKMKSPL